MTRPLARSVAAARVACGVIFAGVVLACAFATGYLARAPLVVQDTHGQTGLLYSLASDPTVMPGLQAPTWQLLVRTDSPSLYYKSGSSATQWTQLGAGGGGGGAVFRDAPLAGSGTAGDHLRVQTNPTFAGLLTSDSFAGQFATLTGSGSNLPNLLLQPGGSGPGGTLYAGAGLPAVTRPTGNTGDVYINGSGGGAESNVWAWTNAGWVELALAGGGGATGLYDTTISFTLTVGTGTFIDDWAPGVAGWPGGASLGANTIVYLRGTTPGGGSPLVTGIAARPTVPGGIVTFVTAAGANVSSVAFCDQAASGSPCAGRSGATNRLALYNGTGVTTTSSQVSQTFVYDATSNIWRQTSVNY